MKWWHVNLRSGFLLVLLVCPLSFFSGNFLCRLDEVLEHGDEHFMDSVHPPWPKRSNGIVLRPDMSLFSCIKRTMPPHKAGVVYKVGLVTTALGKYVSFLDDIVVSTHKYFLVDHEVHIFVVSDAESVVESERLHVLREMHLGWPFDSMGRDHLYYKHRAHFVNMDFMFAIDVDAVFVHPVGEEVLGETVGVLTSWFFGRARHEFTYEQNPQSAAYLANHEGQCYYAGGFFGGTREGFLRICKAVMLTIEHDLRHQYVAKWHDESHLNHYFAHHPPSVSLSPDYMYPEPPADVWLQENWPHIWMTLGGVNDELVPRWRPKILNLGVRKVLANRGEEERNPPTLAGPLDMLSVLQVGMTPTAQDVEEKVTLLVKTFERPACLLRLLQSIRSSYPRVRVIVADDSHVAMEIPVELSVEYHHLTYDTSSSVVLNYLIDRVETTFAVLLDDNFVFSDKTKLENLLEPALSAGLDIVGGCVDSQSAGFVINVGHGRMTIVSDVLCASGPTQSYTPSKLVHSDHDASTTKEASNKCWRTEMVDNFFLVRAEKIRHIRWDEALRLGDHEDMFLRIKNSGLSVALCTGVSIADDCQQLEHSLSTRKRTFDFWEGFFKKWGITKMTTPTATYHLSCTKEICHIEYA